MGEDRTRASPLPLIASDNESFVVRQTQFASNQSCSLFIPLFGSITTYSI